MTPFHPFILGSLRDLRTVVGFHGCRTDGRVPDVGEFAAVLRQENEAGKNQNTEETGGGDRANLWLRKKVRPHVV